MRSKSLNTIAALCLLIVVFLHPQISWNAAIAASSTPPNQSATEVVGAIAAPVYTVAFIAEDDVLNVRSAPGTDSATVDRLHNGETVKVVGEGKTVDLDAWLPIQTQDGTQGWVNSFYLVETRDPADFCDDPYPKKLITVLQYTVRNRDGQTLSHLIGTHGLYIALAGDKTLHLNAEEVGKFFDDRTLRKWGTSYSGTPIRETLADEVTRLLQRDLLPQNVNITCNDNQDALSLRNELYAVHIPGYKILNFYSVLRPGPPGNDLDWGAWGLGVEYQGQKPVLLALGHYIWTP